MRAPVSNASSRICLYCGHERLPGESGFDHSDNGCTRDQSLFAKAWLSLMMARVPKGWVTIHGDGHVTFTPERPALEKP